VITKLWSDPEIYGRIYLQAQMLQLGEIAREKKDELYTILFDVMHKLTAIRYHLEAYKVIEQRMYLDHLKAFERGQNSNSECFELIFMFEAFAFQLKSALDMGVKTLTVVQLKNQISTSTYGDKGADVVKGLRANQRVVEKLLSRGDKTVSEQLPGRIQELINFMEAARESWLREAVDVRDTVSHFMAAKEFLFTPIEKSPGEFDAVRPIFKRGDKRIEPIPFMETLFRSSAEFCQDFMCRTMLLNVPFYELSPADPARAAAMAGDTPAGKFIKWEFTIDGAALAAMHGG
jgi:hypothetical protein